ncbi:hypothetical protein [Lichenifustis flavocetrariae]|uniref:Uncharacterized protein n=1 Tax=Lichenifustis flavocetrariae TaxID=2949735 RepID=A0AA41ZAF0_9HYPH|nr:hypothetical protein [Lichenifustis flavocetrariae]MCW6513240.1 hypothetical protein [Lichenifustis flavocetrariae]
MLGGEVLQSAFHFAFNIVLVHVLTPHDYGVFAIVMLSGGIALTYVRALAGMPATLLIASQRGRRAAAADEVAFGSAALVISVVVGLVAAGFLWRAFGSSAILGSVFLTLWSLRSYLRTVLFAIQCQVQSAISDAIFVVSGIALAVVFFRAGEVTSLDQAFLILALANAAGLAASLIMRRKMRISFGRFARSRYAMMSRQLLWSCTGVTMANVQGQGQVLLIAALAGPAAYAPIAGALVFYAPFRLVSSALANLIQPELVRQASNGSARRMGQLAAVSTASMLVVGLVGGAVVFCALPFINAPVFVGQPKMLIFGLGWAVSVVQLFYLVPRVYLEVLRDFRIITILTASSAVAGIGIVTVLLLTVGPVFSLLGNFVSESVVLVWCWVAVGRADRSSDGHDT